MKNLPIYFFIFAFFTFSSAVIAQDDVYYDPSDDQLAPASVEVYDVADDADYDNYIAYEGVEEESKIDIDKDYNYSYAARIKRFNRPYQGFNYYDPCYTDAYYYNNAQGVSIYNPGNTYYANSSNGFWALDRNNNWVYIISGNNNTFNGFTNAWTNNSYNSYGYNGWGSNNSYGYSNSYGSFGGASAYDPYCDPYSTASPNTAGGGWNVGNTATTNTTTTVRPTQSNNIPGTPTTTVPAPPRGGNGQTVTTNNPKPTAGKSPRTIKQRTVKSNKPSRSYTKPSNNYNKPSRATTAPRSYNKPSRSTTTPRSYSQPSRSSTPSYSSPSRSGGSSGGSKSSGSSRGMRGGK